MGYTDNYEKYLDEIDSDIEKCASTGRRVVFGYTSDTDVLLTYSEREFNAVLQILKGIIEECEAQKSPVILAIHPNELAFQGDAFIQQVIKAANDTKAAGAEYCLL